jgi:hypothetical protein
MIYCSNSIKIVRNNSGVKMTSDLNVSRSSDISLRILAIVAGLGSLIFWLLWRGIKGFYYSSGLK